MVYSNPITSLSDYKANVERHMHKIPQFMLLLIVECSILRLQIVADSGGHHIEHVF